MNQQTELREGRYSLTHVLGAGGMATVYKAHDTQLDTERAVKVLAPHLLNRSAIRARFTVEAQTMAKLQHPNIVSVVDVGVERNQPYMVMEYLSGGSVSMRVEKLGTLTPRQGCSVARQLLLALEEAHSCGIVHRDIKPQNLLISVKNVVKVSDFGIAHIATSDHALTQTGMVMGTLAYMSPEQRTSAKQTDHRSDLYAAAATLFNIVTGKEPFDLFSTEVQNKLLGDLPPPLQAFIAKGSKYEVEERFQSAREMLIALDETISQLPIDPEGAPPLAVPPHLQGELDTLRTSEESFETFDSSLVIEESEPSGTFNTEDELAPPTYRDISLYPPDTMEAPRPQSSAPAILLGAVLIAIVIGIGFMRLERTPPTQNPKPAVLVTAPTLEEQAVDELEKAIDDFAIAEKPTIEIKAHLERKASTLKIKVEAEKEQIDEQLTQAFAKDSELEQLLRDAAADAGGDLDKLGQSEFLAEISPEVRALFVRQQELLAQGRRLETQVKILERLVSAQIEEEKEAEPAVELPSEPQIKPAKRPAPAAAPPEPEIDPKTLPKGTLILNSVPWGTASVDGESVGQLPQRLETFAGKHTIVIESHDGRRIERSISVQSGKEKRFCWQFDEEDMCP